MGSQAVCLTDGLTDDYEHWDAELPDMPHKDDAVLYVPSPCGPSSS